MGQLVFQANAGGQTALIGPNPSSNFSLNVPAVNGTLVTTGDTGTVTNTMLASNVYTAPGTIGSGTPNTGAFTSLSASSVTDSGLTAGRVNYNGTGGLLVDSANMTFNGTTLTLANDASISGLTVGKGGGAVSNNTVVGNGALTSSATGQWAVAVGASSMPALTTGVFNTAVGGVSMFSNTSGAYNAAFGSQSLKTNTTGSFNTSIGEESLYSNTTASNNTAVGYQAGYSQTTGGTNAGFNTFLGNGAGYACTGSSNTLVGANAGIALTSGQGNLIIGGNLAGAAGGAMTTGSKNTLIGSYSGNQGGLDIRTASNYIVLSDGDGNPRGIFDGSGRFFVGVTSTTFSSQEIFEAKGLSYLWSLTGVTTLVVSNNGTGSQTYQSFYLGNGATITGSISTNGTTTSYNITSDRRLKENIVPLTTGLSSILSLKPSEYNYIADPSTQIQGFIADELQAVVPHAVTGEANAVDEDGKPIYQGVDASFLIPHLVSAIQELNAKITALENK